MGTPDFLGTCNGFGTAPKYMLLQIGGRYAEQRKEINSDRKHSSEEEIARGNAETTMIAAQGTRTTLPENVMPVSFMVRCHGSTKGLRISFSNHDQQVVLA